MRHFVFILGWLWQMSWLSLLAQPVSALEYFFDQDPGVGNGTPLMVSAGDTVLNTYSFPLSGLGPGFHQVMVRAFDADGTWSLYAKRSFFVQGGAQTGAPPLASPAEYFLDQDPGIGNGTPISLASGDTSSWSGIVPLNGLSTGFHSLFMRVLNTDGSWSQYQKRTFYLQDSTARLAAPLVAWESYMDQDPGTGNGALTYFAAPVDTAQFLAGIPVAGLTMGAHRLFVRFLDADGDWSAPSAQDFEIGSCAVPQPDISVAGTDSLMASVAGERYLWFRNGILLPDTTQTILAPGDGSYEVRVVAGGCLSSRSGAFLFTLTSLNPLQAAAAHLVLFPNPTATDLHIRTSHTQALSGTIQIIDMQGRILRSWHQASIVPGHTKILKLESLMPGMYVLQFSSPEGSLVKRFMKR